jgi:hypothetical protein
MGQWRSPLDNEGFKIGVLVERTVVLSQKSTASLCVEHDPSEAGRRVLLDGTLDCACVMSLEAYNPGRKIAQLWVARAYENVACGNVAYYTLPKSIQTSHRE